MANDRMMDWTMIKTDDDSTLLQILRKSSCLDLKNEAQTVCLRGSLEKFGAVGQTPISGPTFRATFGFHWTWTEYETQDKNGLSRLSKAIYSIWSFNIAIANDHL